MPTNSSEDRLIKNEQIIRSRNMKAKNALKKYFRRDALATSSPVSFVCECSQLDCEQRVLASIEAYEAIHERKDCFLVYPGHETDQIEKVVSRKADFHVVEKFDLKPA